LLTATLLAGALFFTFALLALTFLFLAILLATLPFGFPGFARFVWIVLFFHIPFLG
jgi:hypothetical protein